MKYYCEENGKFYNTEEDCHLAEKDYYQKQKECLKARLRLMGEKEKDHEVLNKTIEECECKLKETVHLIEYFNRKYNEHRKLNIGIPCGVMVIDI